MKKFTEFVAPVSEALVANSIKESQNQNAAKFQTLLEKYKVEGFASLNEEDQAKFIEDLKA